MPQRFLQLKEVKVESRIIIDSTNLRGEADSELLRAINSAASAGSELDMTISISSTLNLG